MGTGNNEFVKEMRSPIVSGIGPLAAILSREMQYFSNVSVYTIGRSNSSFGFVRQTWIMNIA